MSPATVMPRIEPGVVIAATLDTKFAEIEFVRNEFARVGLRTILVDCGVLKDSPLRADISAGQVAALAEFDLAVLRRERNREVALPVMMKGLKACLNDLVERDLVLGFLGVGGGTNTALATAAFDVLPFGIPKLLVSTAVAGNTLPIVGYKDVMLIHSVVDVLGIGSYLRGLLQRTARVMLTLVEDASSPAIPNAACCVGVTAYGSTTAAANEIFEKMNSAGFDVLTFHARGTGGRAMEDFIRSGKINCVVDLTTTEIADEIAGGISSAGPRRLDAALDLKLPQVLLPGAIDMVNFGARHTIPARFDGRKFVQHTPFATLMRTSRDENVEIANFMAGKLSRATVPCAVIVPTKGFSSYDIEGGPLWDPEADQAFLSTLRTHLPSNVQLMEIEAHINDPAVAALAVTTLNALFEESEFAK